MVTGQTLLLPNQIESNTCSLTLAHCRGRRSSLKDKYLVYGDRYIVFESLQLNFANNIKLTPAAFPQLVWTRREVALA